jgi:hypothetical protein
MDISKFDVITKVNSTYAQYESVSKSFRTESITKYTLNKNKHSLRSNAKGYGGKTH